jgi:hypothetical protein
MSTYNVTRPNIPLRSMASGIHEIAGLSQGETQPTSCLIDSR